jgi:hypothetical protein
LRAETTPEAHVPVLVTDLNDEEAEKFLVTHDPLGAMAKRSDEDLSALLSKMDFDNNAVVSMLEKLSEGINLSLDIGGETGVDVEPEDDGFIEDHEDITESQIRMIQLFFDCKEFGVFTNQVKSLGEKIGTEDITETIKKAVQIAYDAT